MFVTISETPFLFQPILGLFVSVGNSHNSIWHFVKYANSLSYWVLEEKIDALLTAVH